LSAEWIKKRLFFVGTIGERKGKGNYLPGVDNSKLLKAFGHLVEGIQEAHSMKEAVTKAYRMGARVIRYCFHLHVQVSTCLKIMKTWVNNLKNV
jgi:hypothetical protein